MRKRNNVRVLGCTLTLIATMVLGASAPAGAESGASSAAATAAPSSGTSSTQVVRRLATVGAIPKAVQREIDTVHSLKDLARVSPAARRIIQMPAIEIFQVGKAQDTHASNLRASTLTSGVGKAGLGCWKAWITRKRENILGWVLLYAKTTVSNWCNNGGYITSTPATQRSIKGRWGWRLCGVDGAYAGWVHRRVQYRATADAQFALNGACLAKKKTIHSELTVNSNLLFTWVTS